MFNQIKGDRQKNLIEHKNGQMSGDFLPYIPGLLNWVLSMDEESATSIVKNYEANVPSLLAMKARTLVETNPIADWLDNFVVYQPDARTNVGVAKRDKDSNSPYWYLDTEKWLYANYCEYCLESGTRPVSLRRFVTLLSDLGKNQLGLDIRKERNRFGSYFVGLKIRGENDHEPPLITGNTEVLKDLSRIVGDTATHIVINASPYSENTNVINRLWTMVMDKVTNVLKDTAPHMIDYVMDESIDSDGCDECPKGYRSAYDGIIKKSPEFNNNVKSPSKCNTETEQGLNKRVISDKVLNMPSPESKKKGQSQIQQRVTDNHFAITVGDRVEIADCPGHWSWASPFTVEAIDGEMVALEMVNELIEMERLEKCPK